MRASRLLSRSLAHLGQIWQHLGLFFYRFRYLLVWLGVAVVACLVSAGVTYWYLGVYKPAQEVKSRPVVNMQNILENLQVGLSDFRLPNIEVLDLLRTEPFDSLSPQEVWNDALLTRLWIPTEDMGLEQFAAKTDALVESLLGALSD